MSSESVPGLLSGARVMVTGATRGIGAAIAAECAGAGADVAVAGRSTARLAEVALTIAAGTGRSVVPLELDVGDPDAVAGAVSSAHERLGGLDILVNNAGTTARADATELDVVEWDRVLAVNLRAAFVAAREAARFMIPAGHGSIVNIASLSSKFGIRRAAAYGASKGGLAQLTRALALEWGAHGLRVNAVAPGYVETALTRGLVEDRERYEAVRSRIPLGRWGTPADIGSAVVLLCSPLARYVTGQVLYVDGGYTADG